MSSPAPEQQSKPEEELYHSTLARFLAHPSYVEALIAFGLFVEGEREYERKKGQLTPKRRAAYHEQAVQRLPLTLLLDRARRTLLRVHNEWVARDFASVRNAIQEEATKTITGIKGEATFNHKRWRWMGFWEGFWGAALWSLIALPALYLWFKVFRPEVFHILGNH
jgi:hypothetical protein